MTGWFDVWSRRENFAATLDLQGLLALDGFDTGAGSIAAEDFLSSVVSVREKLGVFEGASVFEVGCGAGAFLYALNSIVPIDANGLDWSQKLIAYARKSLPNGDFLCIPAVDMLQSPRYDYVVSNSLFHYLSETDAALVLSQMKLKARRGIAVLDVPDLSKREEAEELRRGALSPGEYAIKYRGLQHTYYEKDWFLKVSGDYEVEINQGSIPNYLQSHLRFNVFLTKKFS